MPGKIILLDGLSLLNRAFYAMPPLTAAGGLPVGGVLGFLNTLFKLYDEESPDFIAVAFDLPKPTFRHAVFGGYKGTRKAMPDDLRAQVPVLKNLLGLQKIKIFEMEGFEADDILATLARKAETLGLEAAIITGDRDLLQTATDKICVKIPRTKGGKTETTSYYAVDVLNEIGVTPAEFIDVKALWGDQSDNIPGVPGIGEKTAVKIIKEFKSVDNAIENAAAITPKKAAENIAEYKEQALMSKALAKIDNNAPVSLDLNEVSIGGIFNAEAFNEIQRLEFKSLFPRFQKAAGKENAPIEEDIDFVESDEDIGDLVKSLAGKAETAFKFIFNKNNFEGIEFAWGSGKRALVRAVLADLDEARIMNLCKPFFESGTKKITCDVKSGLHHLDKHGVKLGGEVFDVMLGAYVLNEPGEFTGAAEIFEAYPAMLSALSEKEMESLYFDIELPLALVLFDMEKQGIKIDKAALGNYGKALGARIDELTNDIYILTGEEFNINSSKQLGVILFEKLLLPVEKKTKTGYSTAADVLERMKGEHPVIDKILEYRQLTKLKSTYADGLIAAADQSTGKIYSTFHQAVTSTGRLSSAEPNLQNIPIRTALGRDIRKVFIPCDVENYVFIDADYSQIELRVLAHMSGDETFIDAFNSGADIHRITASEVFNTLPEDVTQEQRSSAKTVNFGIIYGQSAFSLSRELDITVKEADRYINGYFKRYPGVKKFMEETVAEAKKTGYTTTIMGRRRQIPELMSGNRQVQAFGERAAMNMPIQGSAADIIKIAMVRVFNRIKAEKLRSKLILQVHDELLIEAHKSETELVKRILREEMENAFQLKVPLIADIHEGNNWFEAK